MPDNTQPTPEGTEPRTSATGAEEPDIADEQDLDIQIEKATVKKKGGGGGIFWILLILIAACILFVFGRRWEQEREAEAEKLRQAREAAYSAQEQAVRKSINQAAELASKGEIALAFEQLANAKEKWEEVSAAASSATPPEPERAKWALDQSARLQKAIADLEADRKKADQLAQAAADLEAQAKALAKQRDELNARLKLEILKLVGEPQQPASTGPAAPQATNATSQ